MLQSDTVIYMSQTACLQQVISHACTK